MSYNEEFPKEILYVIVACAGWIAKYLNTYITVWTFKLWTFIASIVISWFSWLMFAKVWLYMGLASDILRVFSGIWWALGWDGVKFISNLLTKRIKQWVTESE
jgi:hypothetical protein